MSSDQCGFNAILPILPLCIEFGVSALSRETRVATAVRLSLCELEALGVGIPAVCGVWRSAQSAFQKAPDEWPPLEGDTANTVAKSGGLAIDAVGGAAEVPPGSWEAFTSRRGLGVTSLTSTDPTMALHRCTLALESRTQYWTTYSGNYQALQTICYEHSLPYQKSQIVAVYENATRAMQTMSRNAMRAAENDAARVRVEALHHKAMKQMQAAHRDEAQALLAALAAATSGMVAAGEVVAVRQGENERLGTALARGLAELQNSVVVAQGGAESLEHALARLRAEFRGTAKEVAVANGAVSELVQGVRATNDEVQALHKGLGAARRDVDAIHSGLDHMEAEVGLLGHAVERVGGDIVAARSALEEQTARLIEAIHRVEKEALGAVAELRAGLQELVALMDSVATRCARVVWIGRMAWRVAVWWRWVVAAIACLRLFRGGTHSEQGQSKPHRYSKPHRRAATVLP